MSKGPLDGVVVVDCSNYIAGPAAPMVLGDLGADVIKVEPPGGDPMRPMHRTPFLKDAGRFFLSVNRNKRSVIVNLREASGRELVHQMVEQADVFIENWAPGTAESLGMGYQTLRARNPRLIYGSVSAFGRQGPHADLPGYDLILQAYAGSMIFPREGDSIDTPIPQEILIGDLATPWLLVAGVLSALYHREQTGEGQRVETSLLAGALTMQNSSFVSVRDDPHDSVWNDIRFQPTYRTFRASDGQFLAIAASTPRHWRSLCALTGNEDLVDEPRYNNEVKRLRAYQELSPRFAAAFAQKPAAQWLKLLAEADIPAGPVNHLRELFDDAQVQANGYATTVEHSRYGPVTMLGAPITFEKTPITVRHPQPNPGEHTDAVLAQFGLTPEQIAELRARGVVS